MSRIETEDPRQARPRCSDPGPRAGSRDEDLALLAGGDLPPAEAARLEEHAAECPACRELLAGLRRSAAALALLAGDGPAADPASLARVRDGIRAGVARIDAERERTAVAPPRWALAAVLLVALLAAAVWLRSGPGGEAGPVHRPDRGPAAGSPEVAVAEAPPEPTARPDRARETGAPPAAGGESPDPPPTVRPPSDRIARAEPSTGPPPEPAGPPSIASQPAGAPREARPGGPQITIRVVSDDPDIVFYWLVEPEENRDEDAVSS